MPKSEHAKQLESLVMTDEQVIAQIDKCIGDGVPINISTMRRGLEILMFERHELMRKLTPPLKTGLKQIKGRQAAVYDYLVSFIAEKGYGPSLKEIATAVGLLSGSTALGHLERLEKAGYIDRNGGKPRAITITGARE